MSSPPNPETRAGTVAIVGLPNAGKSTLLNAFVGEHLSIVTPKAQTTWQRLLGIRTEDDVQMVFVDTPGVLATENLFQRSMLAEAALGASEADVCVALFDGARPPKDAAWERFVAFLGEVTCPLIPVINKTDAAGDIEGLAQRVAASIGVEPLRVSAQTGDGLETLLDAIRKVLPVSPFLYPEDDLAAMPVRYFVQELVREAIFEQYDEEIPYSTACQVEEFRENQDPVYIGVSIFVERKSQKGILIGKRGAAIRSLGQTARSRIEHFLGRDVYLDLWVKVLDGWRRRKHHLKRLGYSVGDDLD